MDQEGIQELRGHQLDSNPNLLADAEVDLGLGLSTLVQYLKLNRHPWVVIVLLLYFAGSEGFMVYIFNLIKDYDNSRAMIHKLLVCCAIYFLLSVSKLHYFARYFQSCNDNLYRKMLLSTLKGHLSYFDRSVMSVILNRFSNDVSVMDTSFISNISEMVNTQTVCLVLPLSVIIIAPQTTVFILVFFILVFLLVRLFLRSLVYQRLEELKLKNHLYTTLNRTVDGIIPLKVFGELPFQQRLFYGIAEQSAKMSAVFYDNLRVYLYSIHTTSTIFFSLALVLLINNNLPYYKIATVFIFSMIVIDVFYYSMRVFVMFNVLIGSAYRAIRQTEIQQESLRLDGPTRRLERLIDSDENIDNPAIEFQSVCLRYK